MLCSDVVHFGMHVFASQTVFLFVCGLVCACLACVTQHEDVVESKGGDVTACVFGCPYQSECVGQVGGLTSGRLVGHVWFACASRLVCFVFGDCYTVATKS